MTEEKQKLIKWIMVALTVLLIATATSTYILHQAIEQQNKQIQDVGVVVAAIYKQFYVESIPWETLDTEYDYVESNVNITEPILFFSSPSCGLCITQEQILKQLKENEGIEYRKICYGLSDNDWEDCEKLDYTLNNSISLIQKYEINAIPTIIYNGNEKRVGTLALENPDLEYQDLESKFTK